MRARHAERGATLIETTLVMGVLLAIMFGVVDFGRAFYTYSFVANAARQGARWAIVRGANCTMLNDCNATSAELQTFVQSLSEGGTTASNITATLQYPNGNNSPGSVAEVTVSYPFKFMAPFVSSLTIPMSSTSEMVISN
jgi:Flp pilus assembly protein TadG